MSTPNTPIRPGSRVSARPSGYFDRTQPVALRSEEARAEFITKTYLHLFGAVLAFTLLEMAYFMTGLALPIADGAPGDLVAAGAGRLRGGELARHPRRPR